MDEQDDKSEQDDSTISIEELVNFVKMSPDEQIAYLINASHKAFPYVPPPEPEVTVYQDITYKHVSLGGVYFPGQTFRLNDQAPEVTYVGFSAEQDTVLVKPVSVHPKLAQYEYLVVSVHYLREKYARGR